MRKLSRNGRVRYKTTTDATGAFVLEKVKAGEYTLMFRNFKLLFLPLDGGG